MENTFMPTIVRGRSRVMHTCLWCMAVVILVLQACRKVDVPKSEPVDAVVIVEGLISPIGLVAVPDETNRLFVIDQPGLIRIIEGDSTYTLLPEPFLDLTGSLVPLNPAFDERGLLGLAFHPNYRNNGRFFVYYQLPPRPGGPAAGVTWNNLSRISEFAVSAANPNQADPASEKVILEWDDPQFNHNGGTLAFGPDGYLYISVGDGGAGNDVAPGHVQDWYEANPGGNGQDIDSNLLGNILRIDVNSGDPYGIPPDNPFVNGPGLDEIYAYGFRNPYRMSFDMGGFHQLYVGDAGQVLYEEVNIVKKGGNYGWNVKEGTHCFNALNNMQVLPNCPKEDPLGNPLIDPIIEINNWQNPLGGKATTVIGGHVYRGSAIRGPTTPNGELYVAHQRPFGLWPVEELSLASSPDDVGYFLKGFGQDRQGEIYMTVSEIGGPMGNTGKVLKLVPAGNGNK
jgi:glucose/arabinose dehydrogenase